MTNWKRLAAPAIVALLATVGAATAQERLTIAIEGAYPPFSNVTSDGKLVGLDVDIADALCAEMKVECTLVTQDWDGMIPALLAGKFDAIVASMTITEERKKQIAFTDRYYSTPLSLVVLKEAELAGTDAAALAGKSVGVQGATVQANYAENVYGKAGSAVRQYQTQDEAMADLENGRVDAVVADKIMLMDWLKAAGGDCCRMVGDLAGTNADAGIALRQEDDALRAKFNAALAAIRTDGTYAKITAKYFDFDIYGK